MSSKKEIVISKLIEVTEDLEIFTSDLIRHNESLQVEIKSLRSRIKDLNCHSILHRYNIKTLEKENANLNHQLSTSGDQFAEGERNLARSLNEQIEMVHDQSITIDSLRQELTDAQAVNSYKQERVVKQHVIISNLKRELLSLKQELDSYVNRKVTETMFKPEQIEDYKAEIRKLQVELADTKGAWKRTTDHLDILKHDFMNDRVYMRQKDTVIEVQGKKLADIHRLAGSIIVTSNPVISDKDEEETYDEYETNKERKEFEK